MPQKQGSSSTDGGRLDGSVGTAVTSAAFALGAGWGGTASLAVRAGSTDQRGSVTITASATTPAQATATVAFTFVDGAYAATPSYFDVRLVANSNAITEAQPMSQTCTTTALGWTHSVLPVAAATYTFNYCIIA